MTKLRCLLVTSLASMGLGGRPAEALDLSVASIEVNQVIQTGDTPLVAGRATLIRVSVDVGDAGSAVEGVDALLRIYVDGLEAPGSPVFSENGPLTAPLSPALENEDHTVNFMVLPPESGSVVFEVTVNPPGPSLLVETEYANNTTATEPLAFVCHRVPEVVYVPIDYRPSGGSTPDRPDPRLIEPGIGDGFVQGIYPTRDWNYHRSTVRSHLWEQPVGSALLNELDTLRSMMTPLPDFVYGWLPGAIPGNGMADFGGAVAYGNTEQTRHQRTFAHELGHCFSLSHNNRTTGLVGVDVEHYLHDTQGLPRIKPASLSDIMRAGELTHEAWVDSQTYNAFFNHPVFDCGAALRGADEPAGCVLYVTGRRDRRTGRVTLNPALELSHLPITRPVVPEAADLVVKTFAEGVKVNEVSIEAKSSSDVCTACRGAHDAEHEPAEAPLRVVVPCASADGKPIDRLTVADPKTGATLAELNRSSAAPQIVLQSPRASDVLQGSITVRWTGSDADGDELTYFLQYSPDGGRSLVPLMVNRRRTSHVFDTRDLAASVGDNGLLRLTATDGFNTSTAEVGRLTTGAGNPPWVYLVTPNDASTHGLGSPIVLHASVWDLEDLMLDEASIEWFSDVDGALGTGRLFTRDDLSVGQHTLTVEATDGDLMVSTNSVTITIADRPLPETFRDCNGNDVADDWDIASGTSHDCNVTGTPDECEVIGGGDFNDDGQVNLVDYQGLADCMGGPDAAPAPESPQCAGLCLDAFDENEDGDVDVRDFVGFNFSFTPN